MPSDRENDSHPHRDAGTNATRIPSDAESESGPRMSVNEAVEALRLHLTSPAALNASGRLYTAVRLNIAPEERVEVIEILRDMFPSLVLKWETLDPCTEEGRRGIDAAQTLRSPW